MTARNTAAIAAAAALLALLGAAPGFAQKGPAPSGPPNALQGFSQNRDQPVKIQSDSLTVRDKEKIATFTGNVHVTQGDTEMRSKNLVVYYVDASSPSGAPPNALKAAPVANQGGEQQIRRIEANGGVLVTQKDQNAAGDNGTFDMQSNTVTLNGNVVVTRGKDVMRGQRLTVDLNTGVSKMDKTDGGQVEGLFQPAPRNEPAFPGFVPQPQPQRPARPN
jgi:lipopolysaccharide export system protein LptA